MNQDPDRFFFFIIYTIAAIMTVCIIAVYLYVGGHFINKYW